MKVGYNNGAFDNQTVKVTWPAITAAELANVGDVNFEGEVEGTATKAMLTIRMLKGPGRPRCRCGQGAHRRHRRGHARERRRHRRCRADKLPEAKKALVDNYAEADCGRGSLHRPWSTPLPQRLWMT